MNKPKLDRNQFLAKMQEGREARSYAKTIITEHAHKKDEFGVQGLWQEAVFNYLKEKSIVFIGGVIRQLATNTMVDFAKWLLDRLEDLVLDQYQKADEITKTAFKKKMMEVFPEHSITKKLG